LLVFNLLTDPWLPVIRRHTGRCVIRPAQVTESLDEDPVIAIDWPRPDFRIATLELLTGLLATAVPPLDGDDWLDWWREPPESAALDKAFAPFAHAFELDGDGPRFLQDLENLESGAEPIERLLIEAPGESHEYEKHRSDGAPGTDCCAEPSHGRDRALHVPVLGAGRRRW
jgi:CRISPR system Cascade subunit CasA